MNEHYLVVGNPIAQSKSPQIHTAFAEQTGQALTYDKALVDTDGFAAFAKGFFGEKTHHGMNITMPFKGDAYNFADTLTDNARLAGAVNTLMKQQDGQILGENTDGLGLVWHMTKHLNWTLNEKNILVIGAGGAVRGVLLPLLKEQPQALHIVNRTASKASDLANLFSSHGNITGGGYDTLFDTCAPFDIIINATSTSLSGELPPVPNTVFTSNSCVYDMVYSSQPTPFMAHAKSLGAVHISDGLGMLAGQAAHSFKLWRNIMPDAGAVLSALRAN